MSLYSYITICNFFISVKQNLQSDYVEENHQFFNLSFYDIYLLIIIHILGSSELKFNRASRQI